MERRRSDVELQQIDPAKTLHHAFPLLRRTIVAIAVAAAHQCETAPCFATEKLKALFY